MVSFAKATGAPFGSGFTTRIAAVSFCAESFDRYCAGNGSRAVTLPLWPGRIEGRVDSMLWLARISLFSSTRTTSSGHVAWSLRAVAFVCDLGFHGCQVNHFGITSRKIVKNCVGK